MDLSNSDSMTEDVPTREVNENFSSEGRDIIRFDNSTKIIKVEITGSHKLEKTVFKYSTYQIASIFDQKGEKENHNVDRRYSDFRWLYKNLASIPGLFLPPFPPKDFFNSLVEDVIETRKRMFQNLLIYLSQTEPIYSNRTLIPFLTLSTEEFAFHKKSHPVVTKFLPSEPSGFMSYFSNSIPKMDLSPLKNQLDEIELTENLPIIETENTNESAELSKTCSEQFLNFSRLISNTAKVMNVNCSGIREISFRAEEAENIDTFEFDENINIIDGNKNNNDNKNDQSDKKSFKTSLKLISGMSDLTSDFLNGIAETNEELSIGVENYGAEFAEIERLIKQNLEISSDLNKADVLISEFKGKIIRENNLSRKRNYESLISSIKEFKVLKEKAKKIFVMNFVKGFEKFRETRIEALERIVSQYLGNQKKCVEKVVGEFEKMIEEKFE